ncbi:hypothetical protein IW261DRAFT_1651029 [Armillaria novae-zelandiae]|uniref:Wax synthase domain-containing protein n=1 Tax=Armillaria novae-zelandiae TaxID=153914 RepID=A0AA39NYV1_9AGAR|nr:hypothetical protein IW261DRAFT_1651029 [Armillaria novae-zelandiae]
MTGWAISTRVAFLPIALYTTYKCATLLDLAPGKENMRDRYFNDVLVVPFHGLVLVTYHLDLRTNTTLSTGPTITFIASPTLPESSGYGWNWGIPKNRAPREWRPTSSVTRFAIATVLSLLFHVILYDVVLIHIEYIAPGTWKSPWGAPILPPSGYPNLKTTYISFLSFFLIYASVQIIYDASTVVGVTIFRQLPSEWPPLYDSVLLSTSLAEFWGHRYHQLFRQTFTGPLALLPLPEYVQLFGAFLMSGGIPLLWGMGVW